jgi:hypothetical protein
MKKFFFFALALCLFVPLGAAQTEVDMNMTPGFTAHNQDRALGDSLWSTSVEVASGDVYNLGVEFDGTNYWVTDGAPAGGQCRFILMDQAGNYVNDFFQPAGTDNTWGIRDLAFDGTYMYGGNDVWNASYISQFDLSGSYTGVRYGPHLDPNMTVTRAVAYDGNNDVFYSANWGSAVFQCNRMNIVKQLVPATGLSCYGAACEESTANTMLWLWWYDATSDHGSEIDVAAKDFTGKSFDGMALATAGGACAYDAGGGAWHLVALHQATPDTIEAYDLATIVQPLEVDVDTIDAHLGGAANFNLSAGTPNAGYVIWASITPGSFMLPDGAVLPFAWDAITTTFLNAAVAGNPLVPFIGTLDGTGAASTTLTIPGHTSPPLMDELDVSFCYTTHNPFDFVSNTVNVLITVYVAPSGYLYDDGTSEISLGTSGGGSFGWYQGFDTIPGYETIAEIQTQFGTCPAGSNCVVALWDDPNNDMDPSDCGAPLASVTGISANEDTDIFNVYDITDTMVSGTFFIGAIITDMLPYPDSYPCPMDDSAGYVAPRSWIANDQVDAIDPTYIGDPTSTIPISENSTIGWPYYWCLRAY